MANFWDQVTAVYDPAGGDLSLYLNGALYSTATVTGTPSLPASPNPLVLGDQADHASYMGLHGNLDDVQFYRQALSPSQVQTLYQEHQATDAGFPKPTAEWRLDEGTGSSAAGTGYNNMVRVSVQAYDADSDLIQSTAYADATDSYTTCYEYDRATG